MRDLRPFDDFFTVYYKYLMRCPFVFSTEEARQWHKKDDYRILLLELDRYADYLQRKGEYANSTRPTLSEY